MKLILFLAVFSSLSFNALSMPVAPLNHLQGRSFKVERVKRNGDVAHGPAALRKAYRKFGIDETTLNGVDVSDFQPFDTKHTTTASVKVAKEDAVNSEQTGAVDATSVDGDVEFVSPVNIGGQTFDMNFDSGSADMWVLSSKLPKSLRSSREVYEPSKSSSFEELNNSTFKIKYGDSSYATGEVGKDDVSIGGVKVAGQSFGLATDISQTFAEDTKSNGIVGLGFSSINTVMPVSQHTFFDNVAHSLSEPVFTVRLLSNGVGEYEFGTVDHSKYRGVMANVSVDSSKGFWQFDSTQYAIGGGPLHPIINAPSAIADTGTSLMLASPDVAEAYYKQVDGAIFANNANGYIFPCTSSLPSLSVAIGAGYSATIPGSFMNWSEVGTNTTTGETLCYGGVQSSGSSSMAIYGDVFLKALFVVFDQRGPSLGFAAPA
ncbi:Peptidase aspartic catalytic [Penicillium coprophilum]|uniref:Peptidase aspartic catalytic n=1 Tax=Penicillium coprophilum TaxID=36646 RepID=UPI0023948B18|nr:Peptidase aspartic catalytic [Penicillium coprophilum]KAJ5178303.1 Peptidase aspartic catalytic [Penicillium coprophilum]